MGKLVRFGVSMEEGLLKKLDEWISKHEWTNRSEAIRDLVRQRLVEKEWENSDSTVMASLTFVYDHHVTELQERLTRMQHDHHGMVLSSMHVHLDHYNCMEVLVLKGKASEVLDLSDRILGTRGVKHGQLVRTSSGKTI